MKPLKLLHTSDWHLGRALHGRKRHEEFEAFLAWLAETIQQNEIDALLVAGDVFDTSAPGTRAQELYYRFLCRVAASSCRHVVIIAGNHDSPSFLDAPGELLRALDVHVVGSVSAPEAEVLVLRNRQNVPELIVCAVPYLRDRDIRTAEPGESIDDKERKLAAGIRDHYAAVTALARRKREECGADIPIVAMGHLFAAGGHTVDGDGVRELYVGSLARVGADIFPPCCAYVALGHLHVPQKVNGSETIRYSGAPLALGFGETEQKKSVCLVEVHDAETSVRLLEVPVFQKLERITGDLERIVERIGALAAAGSRIWLEIVYSGAEIPGNLRERLDAAIAGTNLEILRVKNSRVMERALQAQTEESLNDLDTEEVFARCLDLHEIPEDQRPELLHAYRETLLSLHEDERE